MDRGEGRAAAVRRGYAAIVPLWLGLIPFAIAFGVLARTAGLSVLLTQLFSLVVFAGSAEVAMVTLIKSGTAAPLILLTAFLLNLRHLLYGLSYRRVSQDDAGPPPPLLAFLLTDEVYGVTVRAYLDGRGSPYFLLGAGINLYTTFNLATLAGALLGGLAGDLSRYGLDFIFPLTFLAILLPLLRTRRSFAVAGISGAIAWALSGALPEGVTVLASTVVAAAAGALVERGISR